MGKDWNKPLTKKELKELQKKQPSASPYLKGKSPFKKASLDDLKIDPDAHKKAQKKTKIHNKATQGSGSEKDWLKKTGPQLPLVKRKKKNRYA